MSKTIKRLVFIILLLALIGIISLILPKNILGAEGIHDKWTITKDQVINGGQYCNTVFCIEHGQDLHYKDTYEVIGYVDFIDADTLVIMDRNTTDGTTTTIKSDNTDPYLNHVKNYYKQAFAILASTTLQNDRKESPFELSEKNQYLWHHIYENRDLKQNLFYSDGCENWDDAFKQADDKKNNDNIKNNSYKEITDHASNCWYRGRINILKPCAKESSDQKLIYISIPIEEEEIPRVKLKFTKQDFNGKNLQGAKIKITRMENVSEINPEELTINGKEVTITPYRNTGTFKINVEETNSPTGYSPFNGKITLTVQYDKQTGKVTNVTSSNTNYIPNSNNNNGTVIIKNKPKADLILSKIDSLSKKGLKGVEFEITLTNVESIENYQKPNWKNQITVYVTSDDSGNVKLTGIVPKDANKPIIATIKEVGVPTATGYHYNCLEKPITVTMTYKNGVYNYTSSYEGKEGEANVLGTSNGTTTQEHKVNISVNNQPLINLSGMVWLDGQTGIKAVAGNDGENDSGEPGIDGVLIGLYSVKDKKVTAETKTSNGGQYSFKNVPMTNEGYKIVFSYDGINYIETKASGTTGKDSDATEQKQNRTKFNNTFKTISKDTATSADGKTTTPLGYDYNSQEQTSTLKTTMDGRNPANGDSADFRMEAQTNDTYTRTTEHIDCGLVKKEFDLALVTDVKSARLEINDKKVTYDYAKIMDGEMEDLDLDKILDNNSSDNNEVTYNLYLYQSDYNYRISDYKTDGAIENKVNSADSNAPDKNGDKKADYSNLKELEAYVTYSVFLESQTSQKSTVNEFVYYYDSVYTPYIIDGKEIKEGIKEYTGNNYNFKIEGNKIAFTSKSNTPKIEEKNDYRVEVDIEFEVNKNASGYIELKKDCSNVAEITKYSTEAGGLIDRDSAPDNAKVTVQQNGTPITNHYEDDTDEAKGITISLKTDARTITGTVFEDADEVKDGILNNNDKPVNDVIVQLIEIKTIGNNNYEYIWQETRSGSNQVKTTDRNGYEGKGYPNNITAGSGGYEFKNYIPGNYIIRYIYGDGTTYDLTDAVKTYNGQDYKSTVDAHYNAPWYNTAGYTANEAGEYPSVARDNEARRLEVMAYSTAIDSKIGEGLNALTKKDVSELSSTEKIILDNYYKDIENAKSNDDGYANYALETLKKFTKDSTITFDNISDENKYKLIQYYVSFKTWMAAETSRINVPVDASDLVTDSNDTKVDYKNITGNNTIIFDNVDFGLALRPETRLVLEKHITGLKITPNGTGVQSIVDANADIKQIINEDNVKTEGVKQELSAIKSTRDERGFWKVETDIEELAQGAQLDVEYTYVIKNEGDEDYLTNTLVDAYKNQDTKPYNEALTEIKNTVKGTMRSGKYSYNAPEIGKYLGQYYYTGTKGTNDTEVLSRVEELEEALNNQLKYDESVSGKDFKKLEGPVEKNVYGTNGNPSTVQTETVVQTTSVSDFLTRKVNDEEKWHDETVEGKTEEVTPNADFSKTLKLSTVLTSFNNGEGHYPSYIAEITKYSNAAGRRNMSAEPANLSYVHSDDTRFTLDTYYDSSENKYYQKKDNIIYVLDIANSTEYKQTELGEIPESAKPLNETDEFWAEQIIITKPTGENKITPMQIAIITISSIAVLGVGIILIKKFALKK